ncbi:F420-dependent glucose-6-phosphate dehydrogenase [archaeon BMS3Bbin15]|nr:F420-dependent glucose-6-phosphate dehydrogenase [archaeon BMS3Bbin15]
MEFSLGVTTSMPLKHSIKLLRIAEEKDFSRVFVGEDILSREIFTYLSIFANESRLPVASGILSPYVRSLVLIASGSAGLQLITNNKFTLGIGAGGITEVETLTGEAPDKASEVLRETAEVIRAIFRGERVSYEGRKACLRGYSLRIKSVKVPEIYFGVRGRELLALAGEVADGVIFSAPRSYLKEALKIVRKSAETHGKRFDEIKKVLWNPVAFENSKRARVIVATMLVSTPEYILKSTGLAEEAIKIRKALERSSYDKASKLVSRKALDEYCITGNIADIKDDFEYLAKEGFQEFVISPITGDMNLSGW